MSRWIKSFFYRAKTNRVFIVPTFNGIKLFTLNFILLIMGLIYANNYLLLFNFILFSFFIITMFYTHFNLQDLDFQNIEITPGFSNDTTELKIILKTPPKEQRNGIILVFYIDDFVYRSPEFNFKTEQVFHSLKFPHHQRGIYIIRKISLETSFPLSLFKSFIYFDNLAEIITYPKLISTRSLPDIIPIDETSRDSLLSIREYRPGDKINSILWKKNVPDKIYIKHQVSDADSYYEFVMKNEDNSDLTEKKLSNICSSLYSFYLNGEKCCLTISSQKIIIEPNDLVTLNRCLYLMAAYES